MTVHVNYALVNCICRFGRKRQTLCVILRADYICAQTFVTCHYPSFFHSTAGVVLGKTFPIGQGLCSSTTRHYSSLWRLCNDKDASMNKLKLFFDIHKLIKSI